MQINVLVIFIILLGVFMGIFFPISEQTIQNIYQVDGINTSLFINESFWNGSGNYVYLKNNSNYVGIGTTTPQAKLTVAGDINQTIGNSTINLYHAEMHFHNDAGINVAINQSFQTVSIFNESDFHNGFDHIGDSTLRLTVDGSIYHVNYILDGNGVQNHEYEAYIYINEERQSNTYSRTIGTASTNVELAGVGFVRMSKNDNLTLRISDRDGASTETAYAGSLTLYRISR